MTGPLAPRRFRRSTRRALRRMTELQRAIFLAVRLNDVDYPELAARHGITIRQVEAEFSEALQVLVRTFREREPWWRCWMG